MPRMMPLNPPIVSASAHESRRKIELHDTLACRGVSRVG